MREEINEYIDPDLPPEEQMRRMEELVVDWEDPTWVRGWVETGRQEGRQEGQEETLDAIRRRLRRQAALKFDPETVRRITAYLDRKSDLESLMKFSERLSRSRSGAALLKCLDGRK